MQTLTQDVDAGTVAKNSDVSQKKKNPAQKTITKQCPSELQHTRANFPICWHTLGQFLIV